MMFVLEVQTVPGSEQREGSSGMSRNLHSDHTYAPQKPLLHVTESATLLYAVVKKRLLCLTGQATYGVLLCTAVALSVPTQRSIREPGAVC